MDDEPREEEDKLPAGGVEPASEADRPATDGFTSSVPYEDRAADCVVVTCSDQRFRAPTLDFVRHLGYREPHILSVPSGVAVAHSLAAVLGYLSKAMTLLLSKAIEVTGAEELLCIAHEDCGGYKAGRVKLIGEVTRRLRGKSPKELQLLHLRKAARELQYALPGVGVRAFYADVVDGPSGRRVHFTEIPVRARGRAERRRSAG